jgi:predicted O-linked N-acetylglucosamine transferase (SPINDLY family)
MVEKGELDQDDGGFFSRSDVEDLAELEKAEKAASSPPVVTEAIAALVQGLKQANEHAERMMQLFEKPVYNALSILSTENAHLLERLTQSEAKQMEGMAALGELLMLKAEREATIEQGKVRTLAVAKGANKIIDNLPKLMGQLTGKGGKFLEFVEKLSPEEKAGLYELADAFEDKTKGALLKAGLEEVGIEDTRSNSNE